jgi:hypothetical protein
MRTAGSHRRLQRSAVAPGLLESNKGCPSTVASPSGQLDARRRSASNRDAPAERSTQATGPETTDCLEPGAAAAEKEPRAQSRGAPEAPSAP